jgi:hypothetical protein
MKSLMNHHRHHYQPNIISEAFLKLHAIYLCDVSNIVASPYTYMPCYTLAIECQTREPYWIHYAATTALYYNCWTAHKRQMIAARIWLDKACMYLPLLLLYYSSKEQWRCATLAELACGLGGHQRRRRFIVVVVVSIM